MKVVYIEPKCLAVGQFKYLGLNHLKCITRTQASFDYFSMSAIKCHDGLRQTCAY